MKSLKAFASIPGNEIDFEFIYESEKAALDDLAEVVVPVRIMTEERATLLGKAYEHMVFYYIENTREGDDIDPETCHLRKDMIEIDEDFDCDVCDETVCRITQEVKKIIDALNTEALRKDFSSVTKK